VKSLNGSFRRISLSGILIGAAVGIVTTLLVNWVLHDFDVEDSVVGLVLWIPWDLLFKPAINVARWTGCRWETGSIHEVPGAVVALALAINSVLFALGGGVIGLTKTARGRKRSKQNEDY